MNNPPDFTINDINVIDAPDAIQIRDENNQIRNVNRQTAYNTIVNNPRIQKLSYDRVPDNVRVNLIPDLGSNLGDYNGLNVGDYNIIMNNYYIVALNISSNPSQFIGLYRIPLAVIPAVPAVPTVPAVPAAAPVPQDAEVFDTAEYKEELLKRITCPVCMGHEKNTVLNPCGHLLCAHDSAIIKASDSPICPICRTPIQSTSGIFYGGYYHKYLKYSKKLNL